MGDANTPEQFAEQQQQQQQPWDNGRDGSSPTSTSASVPRLLITGLLMVIAYVYLSDRERRNKHEASTAPTAEDQQEVKQRRLQRFEQQQQQQQTKQLQQPATKRDPPTRNTAAHGVGKTAEIAADTRSIAETEAKAVVSQTAHPKEDLPSTTPTVISPTQQPAQALAPVAKAGPSSDSSSDSTTKPSPRLSSTPVPTSTTRDSPLLSATTTAATTPNTLLQVQTEAETTAAAAASRKTLNKKQKLPREVLLQALSNVTGCAVVAGSGANTDSANGKNYKSPKQTATATIRLSDTLLPHDATWKDIARITQQPSQLFQPLQSHLLPNSNSNKRKPVSYAPTKLSDGSLWKACDWYHGARNWTRDNATKVLSKDYKEDHDNGDGDSVQQSLDQFQQWTVSTVVTQWNKDIAEEAAYYLQDDTAAAVLKDNDDDDDVDLGLFADASYGGSNDHFISSTNSGTTAEKNNKSFFSEIFALLADGSAPQVLSKPFVDHLVQTYDTKFAIAAEAQTTSSLAMILLKECLRKLPTPESRSAVEWDATQRQLTALSNLLTLSRDACQALAETVLPTAAEDIPTDGSKWETRASLRSLLSLVAFTVPRFSKSNNSSSRTGQRAPYNDLVPHSFHAAMCVSMGIEYPVCLYARNGYNASLANYHGTMKHSRNVMKHARTVGSLALKRMAARPAARKGGLLFDWIGHIVQTNEPLVDLLQSDLLSPDSAQALCASRPFLLGLTASLLQLCFDHLSKRLKSVGKDAFDYRYFLREQSGGNTGDDKKIGIRVSSRERFLVQDSTMVASNSGNPSAADANDESQSRFAGATEFFFLTAALLRVSLFPGFRVHEEFHAMLRNVYSSIQQLASQQPSEEELRGLPKESMDQLQKCTSFDQGWTAFVDDPDMSPLVTSFSLLQLEWLAAVASSSNAMPQIPEWFVKLPAQWLAHVAVYTPHLLQPYEGVAAVKFATQILQAGTTQTGTDKSKKTFSPPVLCQLIRIAGAFVREGVRRARAREKQKARRHGNRMKGFKDTGPKDTGDIQDFEVDLVDDRTLDIYHSLDKSDLGVTVFTNPFVASQLCPTLMRAYMAMDAAEGMDVEREHHFEKFEVKHEVADLLLRLWCHPNGVSRDSIVNDFDDVAMNEFSSSVAGALGFQLDQSCQFILDIRDIRAPYEQQVPHPREIPPLPPRDEAGIEHHARFISFSLYQCRRLLMILCKFSLEEKIASTLGGPIQRAKSESPGKSAASDLAAMFVNLIDRFTDADGGIHPELEMRQLAATDRSAEILRHLGSNSPEQLSEQLPYLLYSRRFALLEYGFDASMLAHQLMALAARWHLAAATDGKDGRRTSQFLESVANSDLCNVEKLRNVFDRLVGPPKEMSGSESDNAAYILERDGHVDISIWKHSYEVVGYGRDKGRQRRNTAKQDGMTHSDLEQLADSNDIAHFLDDLKHAVSTKKTMAVAAKWGEESMDRLEGTILGQGALLADEEYTDNLREWVVSSEPFLSKSGNGSFAHSYDSLVRGRSADGIGSAKVLVKEARKCQRLLPPPHPNTSVFVCFAEERTDLCKAIMVGAADTPFSLGIFEFDILFPANYPASPPLFSFKTTGDGRTRISSNLYNDGKVCISILGTYQAWDDSQRWNPSTSSLAQVLASIQTQLLGDEEPYFSEGFNHDSVRGTPAGDIGSERFNNKIRLHTLRHAMIDHLKHPAHGFDEVTKRHFTLCRKRVLAQARRWTIEAEGTPLFKSFVRAYEELATLLSSKDLVYHKLPGQSEHPVSPWAAVQPNGSDLKALSSVDPGFLELHQTALKACTATDMEDAKPAAAVGAFDGGENHPSTAHPIDADGGPPPEISEDFNPWGAAETEAFVAQEPAASQEDNADGDFEDIYA